MNITKRIFLWSQTVLLISLCVFYNYTVQILHKPQINKNHIHKTLYIDRSFNEDEVVYIAQAAISWTVSTNHVAEIDVERLPTKGRIDVLDALIILKVDPDYPEVIIADGFNYGTTLGYYNAHGAIPSIYIVSARIEEKDFKAVVLHEMGHAVGLQHINGEEGYGTLMYPSSEKSANEITHKDLEQFCHIYHCDASKMLED